MATRQRQRGRGGERALLESRLAYHLRCLQEDSTDPEITTLDRLALVCDHVRRIQEIRQALEQLRRPA